MARTEPVTWSEMVANPMQGGMRILANQIADRDDEIKRLRAAANRLLNTPFERNAIAGGNDFIAACQNLRAALANEQQPVTEGK